ncbi:hypothetical protein Patl1_21800 [Pistacia atlantica]|uniref:Uncharacterized protein n=1 Tax=Pistacia atlantica TaxID=434234 RepID=A0ACC1BI48_9ROSI|nr:hypothetical protein Patl1_21800 [Pistacia atlantica]
MDFNPCNDAGLEPQTSGTSGCISQFLWENSSIAEADAKGSKSFVDNLDVSGHQVEPAPSPDFSLVVDDGDEEKLRGGYVDCVRQHVMEAREKLWENPGGKIFEELGFCEMGERISGTISHWFSPPEQRGTLSAIITMSLYYGNGLIKTGLRQISEHEAGAAEEDEGDEEGEMWMIYLYNMLRTPLVAIPTYILSKIQSSYREEDDVQDDSCTSYEFEQIYTGNYQKQSNQD